MSRDNKVVVQNVNVPGHTTRVNAEKYHAMRQAYLAVLPDKPPGLTQQLALAAVRPHLPETLFPGGKTAGWWLKTVQLDLEAKRLVTRTTQKPLTWYQSAVKGADNESHME
ncbi:MAG: hypothetical protein AAF290_02870 [Pseudomonadota bacterium]